MKKAKIYFEGNLIVSVNFASIMYMDGRELRDSENKLVAVVPLSHLIVVEDELTFEIKGEQLIEVITKNTCFDK